MTVELVCVGTELLLGNIVNTNAAYMSEKCAILGLSMYYQSVVGDNKERLAELLTCSKERSDIIILCGGLGPTKDDLTKETAADVMGVALVEDEKAKENIRTLLMKYHGEITQNNWKQAMVPKGSIVLYNENGTAPGIIIESGETSTKETRMILLPGPPNELIPMFENQVVPYLHSLQPETICSKMIKLCGIGESMAETQILDLIDAQTNPTVAPYAKTGEVHLRLTAKAENETAAYALIAPLEQELYKRFGSFIYTNDEKVTLESSIVKLLKEQNLTLATAESCTGGLLAGRLVNVAGVSDIFKEGHVTYSNEAKEKLLGVPKETIDRHGTVSEETAIAMASGGAKAAGADVCISITGIAGPDGGTSEKPVGLVYIGCSFKGSTVAKRYHLSGNRSKIRESCVVNALTFLRSVLLK
ncbi:competence/damage-inducible protein A [Lachnospiraceae bacterium ZAX-1]